MKFEDMINKVICGDCLEIMRNIPDNSIDLVVTSPPYYGQRDYETDGQIGLEDTPENYVNKMVEIIKEIFRTLKKTGSFYLVINDTYGGSGMGSHAKITGKQTYAFSGKCVGSRIRTQPTWINKPKSLLCVPERLMFKCIENGFYLRNKIIWFKPNAMPSSVKDRFTVDFEFVYFFTKNRKYFYKQQFEPTKEPYSEKRAKRPETSRMKAKHSTGKPAGNFTYNKLKPEGKNKRTVWKINTKPYGKHIASYPIKLCEIPINTSSPENGIVLDPFLGSGTTAVACKKLNRRYIGIELNENYCKIARQRIKKVPKRLDKFVGNNLEMIK